MGKFHYFDWAIFNSYFDITRGYNQAEKEKYDLIHSCAKPLDSMIFREKIHHDPMDSMAKSPPESAVSLLHLSR